MTNYSHTFPDVPEAFRSRSAPIRCAKQLLYGAKFLLTEHVAEHIWTELM